jgi:hypothetical protein
VAGSPSLGTNGDIYIGDNSGRLYSFSLQGRTNWIFQASGGISSGATVATDGTVFFAANSQNLYALRPNGTLLWQTTNAGVIQEGSVLLPDGRFVFSTTAGILAAIRTAQRPGAPDWSTFRGNYERTGRAPTWLTPGTTNLNESLHVGELLTLQPRWHLGTQEVTRIELLQGTNVVSWTTNLAAPLMWLSSSVGNGQIFLRLTTANGRQYTTRPVNTAVQSLVLKHGMSPSNTIALQNAILPKRLYELQSSSNLYDWIAVTNHVSTSSNILTWPAVVPNSSAKSFRVRSERLSPSP